MPQALKILSMPLVVRDEIVYTVYALRHFVCGDLKMTIISFISSCPSVIQNICDYDMFNLIQDETDDKYLLLVHSFREERDRVYSERNVKRCFNNLIQRYAIDN